MPTLTILIEDNKTIRDALIPTMAELAGIEVIAIAETASHAIEILKDQAGLWQLAVVDLFLKEGTGLAVLRACKNRRHDQHVVMLTNSPRTIFVSHVLNKGADAIFDKSTEQEAFFEHCLRYSQAGPNPPLPVSVRANDGPDTGHAPEQ